tara:strand:+ start:245 stop:553 length:309 start_codon:yes stop_codon:yes gene_type:complete
MNNTITFSYTREQLESLWSIDITDKMWVDLQTKDSGFQHAVHQEVIGLVEYISDYCDYCSDPEPTEVEIPKKKKKKIIKRPKPETKDEREIRQYLERIAGYK